MDGWIIQNVGGSGYEVAIADLEQDTRTVLNRLPIHPAIKRYGASDDLRH